MKGIYSRLLVVSQYGLMTLMFFLSSRFSGGLALWIFSLGFIIGVWAIAHNKIGNFHIRPEYKSNAKLITTGAYRYIRHPMYMSVFTMMLALLINTPTLVQLLMFLALTVTLYLKAQREESLWLIKNPDYRIYQKRTKLFLPFLL